MQTTTPSNGVDRHRLPLAAMLLLAAAYIFPGLVGHEPWKQDEPYSFDIAYKR
jgi:4-amino-4-deoxy-L-arabinose transferase-like glycosyltransferase